MRETRLAAMKAALEKIADIPLWGETIADPANKAELADMHEYDLDTDMFEPCCDTESSQLQQAVLIAREALGRREAA